MIRSVRGDGRPGLGQVGQPALLCGVVFAIAQYLSSNFWSIPLADIIAELASAFAVLAFTRVWHPREGYTEPSDEPVLGSASLAPRGPGGGVMRDPEMTTAVSMVTWKPSSSCA